MSEDIVTAGDHSALYYWNCGEQNLGVHTKSNKTKQKSVLYEMMDLLINARVEILSQCLSILYHHLYNLKILQFSLLHLDKAGKRQ